MQTKWSMWTAGLTTFFLSPGIVLAQAADNGASWTRMMTPQLFVPLLALSIPILGVVFWGLKSLVHAMRGDPEDFANWRLELDELRTRVEALEQSQPAVETHDAATNR